MKYIRSKNIVSHAEYKQSASQFRTVCQGKVSVIMKRNFLQTIIERVNSIPYLKSQTAVKQSISCIKKSDGYFAETDYNKACIFSEYFSSVFVDDNHLLPGFNPICGDNLNVFTCTVRDVIKVVSKLKNRTKRCIWVLSENDISTDCGSSM